LSVARDITERKKAEKAKHLNESRLEALIKLNEMTAASLDEIAEFAKEEAVLLTESKLGYLAFMNADETALIMHSWSNSAMSECGISDKHFIYPIKTTGLWGEAVRQRKTVITNNYSAPSKLKKGYPEGHVMLTRHMNVPIFDGDHIVAVVGVGNKDEDYDESDARQLTLLMQGMWKLVQQKQLIGALSKYSEELSKANTELRSVNMIKSEFLAENVKKSHDSLHGYDVFDDETLNLLDDSQKEAISTLLRNSERLKRLVDTVLYSNLQQSGKIEYSFAPISIGSVLSDALLNLILLIDEKELVLEKNIPAGLPIAKGDKEKLTDMFVYLIHNAINVTPKGNSINVGVSEEDDYLHVIVTDTGEGIEKDLIPHLFNKMYQVEDSITRMYQGLESSLYICKDTVVAHQGNIWVESEIGKGSSVHVKIPKWSEMEYT
jgi:signal transduction histidine kinase